MKIAVNYYPHTEEVFVWGVWGPETISTILGRLNDDITAVNKALRSLYE